MNENSIYKSLDYNEIYNDVMMKNVNIDIKKIEPSFQYRIVVVSILLIILIICLIVIIWFMFKDQRSHIERLSGLVFHAVRTFAAVALVYALITAFHKEEKTDMKDFYNNISNQWSSVIKTFNDNPKETQNLFYLLFDRKKHQPSQQLTKKEILIVQLLFQMVEDFYIDIGTMNTYKKDNIAWIYHMAHIIFSDQKIIQVWENSKYLYGNKKFIRYIENNFIKHNLLKQ